MRLRSHPTLGIAVAVLLCWAVPTAARAQAGFVVEGRVLEVGGDGIQNALVELIGVGTTLTAASGVFRFEGIEARGYVLRVDAFGYEPMTRFIAVRSDVYEEVELEIQPLALDPLVVEPRTIDLDGRVRDPARELMLVDVDVFTNQVLGTETDDHGRFTLEDVIEDVPLRVLVQAVGYLPVDTVVAPSEGQRLELDLEPDPYAEIRIQAQVSRIDDRAAGYTSPRTAPLNRERLLGWAGRTDLLGVLE